MQAAKSVLVKLGVHPSSRIDANEQDFQYTACRVGELEQYIALYRESNTSDQEKRVLGCFLLESLNEYLQSHDRPHPLQGEAIGLLHTELEIHEPELKYWSVCTSPNPEEWWPIAEHIEAWRKTNKALQVTGKPAPELER